MGRIFPTRVTSNTMKMHVAAQRGLGLVANEGRQPFPILHSVCPPPARNRLQSQDSKTRHAVRYSTTENVPAHRFGRRCSAGRSLFQQQERRRLELQSGVAPKMSERPFPVPREAIIALSMQFDTL